MANHHLKLASFLLLLLNFTTLINAQLSRNFYSKTCPNVESIVKQAVTAKFQQTFVTVPATLRLFFHDCMVQGCDASVMIASTGNNKAEKDHPDNLSLAGDGFDTVIKAKAAVDAVAQCKNKVSCADILALAARDVVSLAGGPHYEVELGRLDGLSSTASSVTGKLPQPTFNLDQLNSLFSQNKLSQTDMIALSGAHTLGFSHCSRFANRIYGFSKANPIDPSLNQAYAKQLQGMCPRNVDPTIAINMDPVTPRTFDNQYYKNLQQGKGLFTSDQSLFTDSRSQGTVNAWAQSSATFNQAFIDAMGRLGRVGVKTGSNGNIRRDCSVFN
ncbi:peroxidase 51-like [Dioscorea cayenensis subsp. rotundata]|uniref:Peroxidase n=1 Tax=Dioscorea cayennensis subsp. rotundata TaxID=55577 RepID=A0AB40CLN5_DIOCR|nr:peroxidase 51-like [Dioscorea cayenensis subsp. rotundata]